MCKTVRIKNFLAILAPATIFVRLNDQAFALPKQERRETPAVEYSPKLLLELKQVHEGALNSDYAFRQLTVLTNRIGPRLSGSVQAQSAVDYVAREMGRLALDVRLEKVLVPHWIRGEEKGELVKFPGQMSGTAQRIILTTLGGSIATPPNGLAAEIVIVDSFEELEALGRGNVEGKIALFNRRFDQQMAAQGFRLEAYRQVVAYRTAGPSAAAPTRSGGRAGAVDGRFKLPVAACRFHSVCKGCSADPGSCCDGGRRRPGRKSE